MPAAEHRDGPWGPAIEYWLRARRLRQSDLVKGTKIEAKTISRITRGFHTQTRKLELIAKYLVVPLERVLVSPLRSGPGEERRQLMRDIIEDAFRTIAGEDVDAELVALAKRIQQLPPQWRTTLLDMVEDYEAQAKKRRRRTGASRAKKSSPA